VSSPLRQAREAKRWTQQKTAAELIALARRRGAPLSGSLASVTQSVSNWERGNGVSEAAQALLCELFGKSPGELGFISREQLQSGLAVPELGLTGKLVSVKAVDLATAKAFAAQVDNLRALDRQLGAPAVMEPTVGLVNALTDLMRHSFLPNSRQPLASALADAGALAAWQALNGGVTDDAWRLFEVARAAGRESGVVAFYVWPLAEQAYVLADLGMTDDAVALIRAAHVEAAGKVPSLLVAWLHAAEAELCAAIRDEYACRSALDKAAAAMPFDQNSDGLPFVSLSDEHMTRWRGHTLARLGDAEATSNLLDALKRMDPTFVRARAGAECDLAQALVVQGELEAARSHLARAKQLAQQTGSIRQLRRAEAVRIAA
jgi:hypothetical protein